MGQAAVGVFDNTGSSDIELFGITVANSATAGRQYPTTTAGGALAWEDIGTSDQRINFTNSAATNAGEVRITITYQQNNNLA